MKLAVGERSSGKNPNRSPSADTREGYHYEEDTKILLKMILHTRAMKRGNVVTRVLRVRKKKKKNCVQHVIMLSETLLPNVKYPMPPISP